MNYFFRLNPAEVLAAIVPLSAEERGNFCTQLMTELITGNATLPLAEKMIGEADAYRQMKSERGKKGAQTMLLNRSLSSTQANLSQLKLNSSELKPNLSQANSSSNNKEPKTYIPDCIDKSSWQSFVDNRKKLKRPMTERAQELMLTKLVKLHGEGWNVTDLLNESILHGWKDVYPKGTPSGEYGMTVTTVDGRKVTVAD